MTVGFVFKEPVLKKKKKAIVVVGTTITEERYQIFTKETLPIYNLIEHLRSKGKEINADINEQGEMNWLYFYRNHKHPKQLKEELKKRLKYLDYCYDVDFYCRNSGTVKPNKKGKYQAYFKSKRSLKSKEITNYFKN